MNKVYAFLLVILGFVSSIAMKFRGDAYKAKMDEAKYKHELAESQNKIILDANSDLQKAQEKGREDVKKIIEEAKNGSTSSMDNNW